MKNPIINILYDNNIVINNFNIHKDIESGYQLDFNTNLLFPTNFDLINCTYDYHLSLSKLINKYYCKYNINYITLDDLKDNTKFIYPITFKYLHNYLTNIDIDNFIYNLNPRILNAIFNNKALIILNDAHEYSYYINLYKKLKYLNVKLNKNVFITSSNLDNELFYGTNLYLYQKITNKLLTFINKKKKKDLKVFGFRYFEEAVALQTKLHYPTYSFKSRVSNINFEKLKYFICLNNVNKDFRTVLCYFIFKLNLESKFNLTHKKIDDAYKLTLCKSKWSKYFYSNTFSLFSKSLPLNLDLKGIEFNPWNVVPWDAVHSSIIWVVTETLFNGVGLSRCYFTEKTYKPISLFMPFIIVGQPFSLYQLKKDGYKTFNTWWDESYDLEINPSKRMNKIIKLIAFLSNLEQYTLFNMYIEMEETIQHNYNILMKSKASEKYINNLLNDYNNLL